MKLRQTLMMGVISCALLLPALPLNTYAVSLDKMLPRELAQKAAERHCRRPAVQLVDDFIRLYKEWKNDEIMGTAAFKVLNISCTTFYNKVRAYEKQHLHACFDEKSWRSDPMLTGPEQKLLHYFTEN